MAKNPRRSDLLATVLVLAAASAAMAQGMPPSPVRYTEARQHALRRTIQLSGTVESRTVSRVASEVAGRVVEFPAREGARVRQGDALVRLSTEELEVRLRTTDARLREAVARLDLAERTLKRAKELFADLVIPQQDLDAATSEVQAWQGRVDQYAAEADQIRLDVSRSTIRAPFSGTVVEEHTELGQWLAVGDAVAEILALDDLEVRVEVPERYYRNLDRSAVIAVTLESLPDLEIEGRVRAIVPRADPQARTFPLVVRIPNQDSRIGVGMLAQVSIPAGDSYQATLIPKDALVTNGRERFVYVLNGDNTVARADVQPGDGHGAWIAVQGDVKPGQKVVTRGNERLLPGQAVQPEPATYDLP